MRLITGVIVPGCSGDRSNTHTGGTRDKGPPSLWQREGRNSLARGHRSWEGEVTGHWHGQLFLVLASTEIADQMIHLGGVRLTTKVAFWAFITFN